MKSFPFHHSIMKNYSVECARTAAILLVILHYVMYQGGIQNDCLDTLQKLQARFLETSSQCCLNIFAIITGYVCLHKTDWRWKRLGALWIQVFVTGLLMLFVSQVFFRAHVTSRDWVTALLPVTLKEYWYFTSYAIVFVLVPFINRGLRIAYRRFTRETLLIVIVVFAVIGLITACPGRVTLLHLNYGQSAIWLILLYVLGAIIRLADHKLPKDPLLYFSIAIMAVIVTTVQRLSMSSIDELRDIFNDEWTLIYSTSPTMIIMGVSLFLAITRLPIKSPCMQKTFSLLGSTSFGCYLFLVQPVFFAHCFKGHFAALVDLPSELFGVIILAIVVLIYLLLSSLDLLRQYLTGIIYAKFHSTSIR